MESLTKSTVFRVSDLPNGITAQQLESVINDKLREQEKANINFTVNLVPSPYIDGQSQVALVDFKSGTPQFLSALTKDPLGDWQIEIDETEVITFDRHFHGFTQLYSPERPVSADIIAITGLDGHAYGSWKGKGNLGRMWLRHFLSQDLPHCRTMIYGYDSRLTSHGINTIMDYGREFLEEIKQVRNTPECLVKIARTFASDHPTITSLLGSTHGILLFAIPHRGLVVDDIRKMLAEDENHPRHTLLQQINMKSDLLTGQLVDFKNLIRDRKIVSFYETKQTRQLEFNTETQSWGRTGKFATTVEMDSAMLQLPDHLEDKIPLHEDHSSIVKFDSKSAQGYRSAIRNLKQFEQEAPLIISSRFMQLRLAATPSSTVPFKRDKMFVGREDILERVESIICGMSAISQHNRAALVGIGGIGKSQIAIEYSHRCREHSPETWVFWVHGGNAARFEAGYKKIAERVKLIGWEKPNTNILELVSDWLSDEANGRWIMIIDNADDAGVFLHLPNKNRDADENRHKHTTRYVSDFLPQTSNGSILITSRNRDAAYSLLGNYSDIISVTPMGQGDALSLLQKLAKYGIDDVIALELLEELDYIPLAIGQAAAYIGQRSPRVTVSTYLDEFRRSETSRARLLEIDSGDDRRDGRASNSIISTWQISFEHIRQTNPRAARLLSLMSLFDRQGIPVSLLKNYYQRQFDNDKNPESKNPLKRRRSDSNPLSQRNQRNQRSVSNPRPDSECRRESDKIETEFEDDIHILRSYSLVADMTETTFEMHRLVQFSTKKWLEVNNRLEELKEAYIKIIDDASPSMSYDIETQKLCQKLFPHMVLILTYRPINDNCLEQWASVLSKTAWHALAIRDYSMGEKIAKQAIEAYEKLGLQNLTTLRPMFDLARAYHAQEKWKEGLELITKMELYTELLGKGHPARISTFNMVARFYMNQNQLDKAEELLMEAFGEMPTEFGREHPLSLDIRTSLAWIYCRKDQLEKAENMHLQVLETRRRVLGKGSLLTASSMQDLGFVYVKQERWNEAEKLYMESLEINRRVFGPDDRGLVENMESLGYVLNKQEQWTKAEMLHRRVLEIRERELGSEHTLTLKTMDHLQVAYMGQKKYKMAEELVKKIFEIQKKTLGPEDEKTLFTMLHLSSILWSQKCRDEALELLVPCVTMSIDTLGGSHPHTLARISVLNTVDQG
ncbi:hypothetical protein EMCG_07118 [[Emmonsia] crescens]|uniref:Uncharacterized protein n=1 Tax=[Emmonsia] crescens TaxID=73230 RepID=A0A0G2I9G3_9EURO|nr:hypothetical protein EMCG_07118 [Emmonsia crescens UAMH 3008]